jgi:excinuclease ABC subunit C
LYYHIGQCLAPCIKKDVNYVSESERVIKFLKGDTKEVISSLEAKMLEASSKLEFEKALEYKNLIDDVRVVSEKQIITSLDFEAKDVVGIYVTDSDISIEILYLRNGSIVANYKTIIPLISDIDETLTQFLTQFYENEAIRPKEVLINDFAFNDLLTELLNVSFTKPIKGSKKELLLMAENNAKINIENSKKLYENKVVKKQENIYKLGQLLGIKAPIRIEAFDNSNLFGEYPVSAMVCFVNGVKSPKDYRKYHVKTVVGANDYDCKQRSNDHYRCCQRYLNASARI